MECLENTYLEFSVGGFCYLTALQAVKEICSNEVPEEELPILDWDTLTGETAVNNHLRYRIVLEYQGKLLGIGADRVAGMRNIEAAEMLEMKKPIRNERNRFICAAADLKEDSRCLAFVLDTAVLAEYILQS